MTVSQSNSNEVECVEATSPLISRARQKLHQWANEIWFWILLTSLTGLIGLISLPDPNVMVSATIETETLQIEVTRPDTPPISLQRALLETDKGEVCIDDVVVYPKKGAKLYYSQSADGRLYLTIEGASVLSSRDSKPAETDFINLTVSPEGDCLSQNTIRLPVTGLLDIGMVAGVNTTPEDSPLVIHRGELQIYGRAVDRIFGLPIQLFGFFLPMEPDRLYLADTISLPAGSRVFSDSADWGGFVDVRLTDRDQSQLRLSASANARSLKVLAAAPRTSSDNDIEENQKPDTISMTFGARLSNDPNIRWVFALCSFILLLLGIFFQLPRRDL